MKEFLKNDKVLGDIIKTEKCDLHFTESEGAKALHLKWDISIPEGSHKVSHCNWKIWKKSLKKVKKP